MTVNNLPGNVDIFSELAKELFINVQNMDKEANGEANLYYNTISYLKDIETNLNT